MPYKELTVSEKNELVKKEQKKLGAIFKRIEANKLSLVGKQIENLAWYSVSVNELQARLNEYGTLLEYNNGGGQAGYRENPDVKTLIGYQKIMNEIMKMLIPLVPAEASKSAIADLRAEFGMK